MTIKDAKRNFVIDCATELFLTRSVRSVTVKDIAASSGVGEATVYRYFSGKGEILVASALKLQEEVSEKFLGAAKGKSGFSKIERFYSAYLDTLTERPELYRFLSEFDAFCVGEGADLEEYADHLDAFRDAFLSFYGEGVADGSVRKIADPALFYYSTAHALLSMSKKLALEGELVRQDRSLDKSAEVATLIEIILASLKK